MAKVIEATRSARADPRAQQDAGAQLYGEFKNFFHTTRWSISSLLRLLSAGSLRSRSDTYIEKDS